MDAHESGRKKEAVSDAKSKSTPLRSYGFFRNLLIGRSKRNANMIADSGMFDAEWYLNQFPDAVNFPGGPIRHFLVHGFIEGASPHPLFDLKWYRSFYRLNKNINPLIHFIANSRKLSYKPNAFFDIKWYAETYLPGMHLDACSVFNHYYTKGEKDRECPSINFIPTFYANTYPGTLNFRFGLLGHYIQHGRKEKMIPFGDIKPHSLCLALQHVDIATPKLDDTLSKFFDDALSVRSFFESCRSLPEDLPLRFDPDSYIAYNPDLHMFEGDVLGGIRHFLSHGVRENRIYRNVDAEQSADQFYSVYKISENELNSYTPQIKTCLLVHIFYPELYSEIKQYISNTELNDYDIYFNLVENSWSLEFQQKIITDFPKARIVISQNIGRDIGGFFNLVSYIRNITSYDAFLLLHSKRSPHNPETVTARWRKDLMTAAIGSREITLQNLYLLEKEKNIGLIGSEVWRRNDTDTNNKSYSYLLKVLGISRQADECDYVSGTMMWTSADVIDYLYSHCKGIEFENGNNRSIQFHKDGQLAHGVERVFGNICRQLNLRMIFR